MNLKMSLDKKSLIQIIVLVVLVVGGAGAYLMQQDGGLDFITGFFESDSATPARSSSAPVVRMKSANAPANRQAREKVPEIPSIPAKGEIHGMPFIVESSSIENGVLTLRLGKDVTADLEVRLMLSTPPWEVPAGKTFKVLGPAGAGAPQVVLAWKEPGQPAASEQKFTDKYKLLLDFGQEKNGKLPGKIYLTLPDEVKSNVAGTFDADIKGFRIVDGKPDLAADSVDTLQFLALRDLLKNDASKTLNVVALRDGRYAQAEKPGGNMTGYIEVEYRLGQAPPSIERFQFEKAAGVWKVARTLNAHQLDEAHPLQTPGPQSSSTKRMTYLAAGKLEADIQKKSPLKGIYEPAFTTRLSDKFKIGVCEIRYKLAPDGDTEKTVYLFRRQARGWTLERELGKKEKVNFDTGRIVRR
ncbi:MAG: hypothetical protein ACYDBW_02250 [Sulfuricaulis sp.]